MKNKIHSLLLLAMNISMLVSCHKAPQKTVIQGHILEYGTNTPIEGARIYLWCYDGEIFGPTRSSFVDSLVTDETGAFHTEYLDRELCGGIYLSAHKEGYFYRNDIDIHGGVNDFDVVLDPKSWLKLITIPDNGISHLFIGGDFLQTSGLEVSSSDTRQQYLFETRGNRLKHLRWRPWGDFNHTTLDSVYVHGLDTTTYTIHY